MRSNENAPVEGGAAELRLPESNANSTTKASGLRSTTPSDGKIPSTHTITIAEAARNSMLDLARARRKNRDRVDAVLSDQLDRVIEALVLVQELAVERSA